MNTKIGTSFGLALLMAIAVVATMFALGMFSTSQVRAAHDSPQTWEHVTAVDFVPASSSVNAGTSWNVTFGVSAALVAGSGTITVSFPTGTVLPATIDKTRISVSSDAKGDAVYTGYPLTSDPTVTSTTVTLTVPASDAGGSAFTGNNMIEANDNIKVFFSQLAGVLNPAKSGVAGTIAAGTSGKVKTSGQATYSNIAVVETFNKTIAIDLTTQVEGGAVEVKLAGFTPDLKCTLSGSVSGSGVPGSDRKVTIAGTKKSSGTSVTALCTDAGTITSVASQDVSVKAELTATATGKAGDTITLTGKNFTGAGNIATFANVLFGGTALTTLQDVTDMSSAVDHTDRDNDNVLDDFLVKIRVPSGAVSGANQIKVTDSGAVSATATVTVTGRTVLITPDTGPPGTVITITGEGFPASRATVATSITSLKDAGSVEYTSSRKTGLFTTGTGELPGSDQQTIPADAATAVITVTVSIMGIDDVLSSGTDLFTVTGRVLTVSPTSGPRGTSVLITGTKFTASDTVAADSVTVDGVATTHAVANLTSAGDVPGISLAIPAGAGIGSKTVSLTDGTLTGTVKFEITVPTLVVGLAEAHMGQAVPITGTGWVPSSAVTLTLASASTTRSTKVVTADTAGAIDTTMIIPSTVDVGPVTVTFTAEDQATYNNDSVAQTLKVPKPTIALSTSDPKVGDVVDVTAAGFPPLSGLSILTIGGADVSGSTAVTSDSEGGLTTSFIVPGVTGSNIVTVKIGATEVSTSVSVAAATTTAAATTAPADIFADVIANDDNLVRVWRFSNADQTWAFYDPRAEFASANTLEKSGTDDIVWVNVSADQTVTALTDTNSGALISGWNLIVLK
jgi:hypothetical protein